MNESTAPAAIPILFIHGLWMHASTWDSWVTLFNQSGYQAIAPGWPGDSATPAKTRQNAEAIRAYYSAGAHHPHLEGGTVGDWPLNVFDDKQAAAQLPTLRAVASADLTTWSSSATTASFRPS